MGAPPVQAIDGAGDADKPEERLSWARVGEEARGSDGEEEEDEGRALHPVAPAVKREGLRYLDRNLDRSVRCW